MINIFCDNDGCMGKYPLDLVMVGEEATIKCSGCNEETTLLGKVR